MNTPPGWARRFLLALPVFLYALPALANPPYGEYVCHREGCTQVIENRDGILDTWTMRETCGNGSTTTTGLGHQNVNDCLEMGHYRVTR